MICRARKKIEYIIIFLVAVFLLFNFDCARAEITDHNYPRLANYYLSWNITESQARKLAEWDVLILDMELQEKNKTLLKKIRQWNPDITMLVYITPQEIMQNAANSSSKLRRKLVAKLSNSWYLQDSSGKRLSWWPGTYLLNVTNSAPKAGGKRLNQVMAEFVASELLASGLWDGVYYDNAWDNIAWFAGSDIDLNLDGREDSSLDSKWRDGMKLIFNETRRLAGDKYVLVGNNTTREYQNELNGMMMENFGSGDWADLMEGYEYNNNSRRQPRINFVNFNTGNKYKSKDYQKMRFGLTSALLENGYYSFDYGDQDHGQLWWYDEYDVNLGEALSASKSKRGYRDYQADVWQRDFTNGVALVNSTDKKQNIDLGGEFEKIHGAQQPEVNDGSIVTETVIDGYDGLILLKSLATLTDVLYTNGNFVRFFSPLGERVRNGFFVFESGYKGGDQIARIDLDGNGKRDLLVVHKNKIMAWRDDGQIYMKKYPYTAMYKGDLRVALGDLNADSKLEVYVAPSEGYSQPVKIYTRHGRKMRRDWYPLGNNYSGGMSLAVGNYEEGPHKRGFLLVGSGSGVQPQVRVYDYYLNKKHEWTAFESWFRGGVNLAAGDVNGDGDDEAIVGAGPGKKPVIKVFNQQGSQLYPEFTAYTALDNPGIEVRLADVDFDGVDDIIGMSSGF